MANRLSSRSWLPMKPKQGNKPMAVLHMRMAGLAAMLTWLVPVSYADDMEAALWLSKMATAAHQQSYSGVFVHQSGSSMDSLRIIHLADEDGETIKLETLDGSPRRMIRHNKQGYCLIPGSPPQTQESAGRRRIFPGLLPLKTEDLLEHYRVRLKETDRVAGQSCQVVVLEPKDQYRYGYSFCAAIPGGLMLRARLLSEQQGISDNFVFSELSLDMPSESVRKAVRAEWQAQGQIAMKPPAPLPTQNRWHISTPPSGFQLLSAVQRPMPGRPAPVSHMVYSDGLATVSVFVELPRKDMPAMVRPMRNGVTGVYVQNRFQHQITAVGEVPAATLMQFVNATEPQ